MKMDCTTALLFYSIEWERGTRRQGVYLMMQCNEWGREHRRKISKRNRGAVTHWYVLALRYGRVAYIENVRAKQPHRAKISQ
jgi:hypothetical protein